MNSYQKEFITTRIFFPFRGANFEKRAVARIRSSLAPPEQRKN
jgi:hypothetical protein